MRPVLLSSALLYQLGGGKAFDGGNDFDLPTPGLDFFGADYGIDVIVTAFDDHVRPNGQNYLQWGGVAEDHYGVYRSKGSEDAGSFALADNWAGRALQCAYGGVAVDCNYESVAELACLFEHCDMTDVQEVKAAVGENNPFAVGLPQRYTTDKFGEGGYLVLCEEGNLRGQCS